MVVPAFSWSDAETPATLDHILLGCSDLEQGIAFVEEHTGVRAAFGGVHPGRGTRNALLSLGTRRYLEIIAPDPRQSSVPLSGRLAALKTLSTPRLIAWAAHVEDIDALASRLRASGMAVEGPFPGARARPDGRMLKWKTLEVSENAEELFPFFIEWASDSIHPAEDAPKGCTLEAFGAETPQPDKLAATFKQLGIQVPVAKGQKAELRARIAGLHGKWETAS